MKKILSIAFVLGIFIGFLAVPTLGIAQQEGAVEVTRDVKIISLEGTAGILIAGAAEWVPASIGDVLIPGDTLRTDPMSTLELNFDGSGQTAVIKVSENAELTLNTLTWNKVTNVKDTILDLTIGSVLIKASKLEEESKFEVNTPTSIVGVRGTTFEVRVSAAE